MEAGLLIIMEVDKTRRFCGFCVISLLPRGDVSFSNSAAKSVYLKLVTISVISRLTGFGVRHVNDVREKCTV